MSNNIALFTLLAPEDKLNGADLRIWTLLGGGQATVVCLGKKASNENGEKFESRLPWQRICELKLDMPSPQISPWNWTPNNWLNSSPAFTEALSKALSNFVKTNPGLVWIAFPVVGGLLLSHLFQKYHPAVDITDSYSLYFLRRFKSLPSNSPLKRMNALYQSWRWLQFEKEAAKKSSAIFTAGEEDKAYLSKKTVGKIYSFGTGTAWISQPVLPKAFDAVKKRMAFFGGMTWEPNRATARYLAKEMLPVLRKTNINIELAIAGSAVEQNLADLRSIDGLCLKGFVPDLRSWLSTCEVFVMPMFQGAGVKNKLLEAMASGAAVVTNSVGAESLPIGARDAVMIADGTDALVAAVVELLNCPAKREQLELRARVAAEQYFDPAVISAQYRSAVLAKTAPWTIS